MGKGPTDNRFNALAGWNKDVQGIWDVLNPVMHQVFSQFTNDGKRARPCDEAWFNQEKGFGYGTVHHAVGTLRMSAGPPCNAPFSSSAIPVLILAALALRLSERLRTP